MENSRSHLTYKRFFGSGLGLYMVLFAAFSGSALAHEITILNYTGTNVVAGALTFPVGKSTFDWPYGSTNLVFEHNGFIYSFPVTNDFQLVIDAVDVYWANVTSPTEWFFTGFGLATTIAGFFWIVRIVNQIAKAAPEAP